MDPTDTDALTRVVPRKRVDDRVMQAEIGGALQAGSDAPVEVGRFVVLGVLGTGAMGSVYRAYDPQLDRRVAVKVIASHAMHAEVSPARLMREASALARLNHPNVVTVYEAGQVGNEVFLAMELVEGVHLGAWARTHKGDPRALELLLQAARGLAAAHRAGIVHRDFKPANVLVGDDGRVRVADFGLARTVDHASLTFERPDGSDRDRFAVNTGTGLVVGTPRYMAPEQRAGKPVDARSDQFSFCVAAWEVLFGRHPWPGGIPRTDPFASPTNAPAELEAILRQGLDADPARRHASMDALAQRLEACRTQPPRKRWPLIAAASAAIVAAVILAFVAMRPGEPAPSDRMPAAAEAPTLAPLAAEPASVKAPVDRPDLPPPAEETPAPAVEEPRATVDAPRKKPRPTDDTVLASVRASATKACRDQRGPTEVAIDFLIGSDGRPALLRSTADARSGCVVDRLRAAKFRAGTDRRATLRVSFPS